MVLAPIYDEDFVREDDASTLHSRKGRSPSTFERISQTISRVLSPERRSSSTEATQIGGLRSEDIASVSSHVGWYQVPGVDLLSGMSRSESFYSGAYLY